MPPHVPRKRLRGTPPPPSPPAIIVKSSADTKTRPSKRQSKSQSQPIPKTKAETAPPRKPTLFDDLDSASSPRRRRNGVSKLLDEIADSSDEDSPLSSLSDVDFEDVPFRPPSKRQKTVDGPCHTTTQPPDQSSGAEENSDDDLVFEDVPHAAADPEAQPDAPISGELELTLVRDTRVSLANALGKKGPSKRERQIRVSTHCIHVLLLMWHNAVRNAWLCDGTVQGLLLSHLPGRLWDEVERWRVGSGLVKQDEEEEVRGKGGKVEKGEEKGKTTRGSANKGAGRGKAREYGERRDWGSAAQRLENGAVDRSQGDPLYRLMKVLSAWWKQRFRVTAPGLRKWGYMSLERLDRLTKAFKEEDANNSEKFGERVASLDEFRECAQECNGSRDVGAQLFTALLRGLGLEARLVASLQPLGFGWNKLEEADPEKESGSLVGSARKSTDTPAKGRATTAKPTKAASSSRSSGRSSVGKAIPLDATDSELQIDDSADDSVIDLSEPEQRAPRKASGKLYDKDLEFPHYWTEVLSPVQNKYIPVEPLVKSIIGTNPDLIQSLEPRGGKADKAKQVIAYVLAYSQDGTAKDVTVRYLKRKVWPGRTKGNRIPVEKIPVYNRHGKVKRHDMFDWFKSAAMRGYAKGLDKDHPFTEIDYDEDATDLKHVEPAKKEFKEGEETLQYYKQSKEFVLERHLKREEALLPGAKVIKYFKKGTGKNGGGVATEEGEPVYLRKDVVQVKSAETWHKQGRAPLEGEQPLKRVPYRAATTNRRREIAEAELATGAKVLQGLYSFDQTDWIIPAPIENGVIPKNEYGNIDLFAAHMCPHGAVHVPYRGAMRVCKRLGIDYAEAVVDFEFGHRMAVPVIQGVVVAEEHHDRVMEELAKDEAEKSRKEDEKRRKAALGMWRKFLMGLRIVERLRVDYGDFEEGAVRVEGGVFKNQGRGERDVDVDGDENMGDDDAGGGGGFIPEGYELEEEEESAKQNTHTSSSFFPTALSDEEDEADDTLMIDHGDSRGISREQSPPPIVKGKGKSVMSTRPKRKATATKTKTKATSGGLRRRRRNIPSSSEGEEDEEEDAYMDSDDDG